MSIKILSSTFNGIDGVIITVEIDIARGLPTFNIVGLANTSVRESKERVHAAIKNSGFQFPLGKITVNLAPADIPKEGALLDLPIAVGILLASGQICNISVEGCVIVGELSLSGGINGIKGALPVVIEGIRNGITKFIVPSENADECSALHSAEIFPFNKLKHVADFIEYGDMLPYRSERSSEKKSHETDFSDIIGQNASKRALEIACAGGHNVIIFGPPGCGKTMLASRIPTILPDLTYEESLEITKIYSIVGKLHDNRGLISERPFRNPHHSCSMAAMLGGGNKLLPGEITLSHHGVLFLDELLEYKRNILELLREPMESRTISLSRNMGSITYPANFMLIG
ncbi:MAG: YifB family Mg chelatase-like AAA ATPase, partial [Bacillota bacterium]|nr:YifB family Mg chelatase-like AAA ATPase [Bacillota bacterium]